MLLPAAIAILLSMSSMRTESAETPSEEPPENAHAVKQLVGNGGFEQTAKDSQPLGWFLFGATDKDNAIELDKTEKHSGERSLKLTKNGETRLAFQTERAVQIEQGSSICSRSVRMSAWMKFKGVVAEGANSDYSAVYLGLSCYDKDSKLIVKEPLFSSMGNETNDWSKHERVIEIPANAAFIHVFGSLNKCKGTMWVDDIRLSDEPMPSYLPTDAKMHGDCVSFILPTPWKESYGKGWLEFGNACIVAPDGKEQERTLKQLSPFLKEHCGREITVLPDAKGLDGFDGAVILGSIGNALVADYVRKTGVAVPWGELGTEGYFLWSGKIEGRGIVIMASNEPAGAFYAFQSLKQIVKPSAPLSVREVSVVDRPLFKRRGVFAGGYLGKRAKDDLIEIMAEHKMNYLFLQGGLLNYKFKDEFRVPFSPKEIERLKALKDYAEDNFVQVQWGFAVVKHDKPIEFSSEADLNLLLRKIDALCEIGFQQFDLSFDDIQALGLDRLYTEGDRKRFASVGKAHAYLIARVYDYVKSKGAEYRLDVVPMTYYFYSEYYKNAQYKSYLEDISSAPADVRFIVAGGSSCVNVVKIKDITDVFIPMAKHQPIVLESWSDFDHKPMPFIAPPFQCPRDLYKYVDSIFPGQMQPPSLEGPVLISWYSSSDYVWNPEAYDPDRLVWKRLLRFAGSTEVAEALLYYMKWEPKLQEVVLPDKGTAQERVNYCAELLEDVERQLVSAKDFIDRYPKLKAGIEKSKRDLASLLDNERRRAEFPVPVPSFSMSPKVGGTLSDVPWDSGRKISNFHVLGKQAERATPDTEVFLGHDRKNFYLKFNCLEPEPQKMVAKYKEGKRDQVVYLDDCVEMFIDPTQSHKEYYHIIVNSKGAVFDEKVADSTWDGSYELSTRVEPDSWSLELRIPCANFGVAEITPGMRWNIDFMRERKVAPPQNSSLGFSEKRFVSPTRFEVLEFK